MKWMLKGALGIVLGVTLGACGKDSTSGDAAAAAAELSNDDVAACEASVDAVYAACNDEAPGAPRLCVYEAYRPFCKTGRTAVVKAIFDCLKLDACQTPGDPSAASDCVSNVVHTLANADDKAAAAAICGCGNVGSVDCAQSPLDALTLAPDLMLLPKSDEDAFTKCIGSGCNGQSCLDASPLGAADSCPGL
jgi:hypothetical protein